MVTNCLSEIHFCWQPSVRPFVHTFRAKRDTTRHLPAKKIKVLSAPLNASLALRSDEEKAVRCVFIYDVYSNVAPPRLQDSVHNCAMLQTPASNPRMIRDMSLSIMSDKNNLGFSVHFANATVRVL